MQPAKSRTNGMGLALALAIAGQASAAFAFGERLSVSGQLAFGIAPDSGQLSIAADADAALAVGAGFALNLGFYGAATDVTGTVDTPHETYGTLSWQGQRIGFAVGVPRPAYDKAALPAFESFDPIAALDPAYLGAARSRATWGALYNGDLPLGLRVDGTETDYTWAVSAHRMDGLDVASAGVEWSPAGDPALQIGLGAELSSDGNKGAKASLDRQFGALSLGGAVFLAPVAGATDFAEARLAWAAQPGLDVSLIYIAPRDGAEAAMLGVQKEVGNQGFLKGAVRVDGDDISSLVSFGLTFGY
jgi:hypothetical protein